jgi:beta-mannosidase
VPGSVQYDLWQHGEIPNPYFERNSLLAEWVPQRTWVCKKNFTAGESLKGQRVRLCFEGWITKAGSF